MTDYKKMYFQLFNSVTDAIHMLQQTQQQVEEIYIQEEDADISVIAQQDSMANSSQ